MKRILMILAVMVITLSRSLPASALLIDRGGGMIYDTDLNITWLQDTLFLGGQRSWSDAVSWADTLVYGGFDDWRLPTTLQPDPTCDTQLGGVVSFGFNCAGSELGHLYYTELGNAAGGLLVETGPFTNLVGTAFWSGTEYAPNADYAWIFYFSGGYQIFLEKDTTPDVFPYAWAVRSGDVASVPEPASLLLLGSGLAGLVMIGRKFRR